MPVTTPPKKAAAPAVASTSTGIRLARVTKHYGLATPAVDDISLSIEPGEFMTLLGPSGSGKTTTLNLIAGFETLTAGSIAFDGADVSTLPPHKRNLGMLFQNYALFPHMTVAQNVAYPLRERKVGKPEITRRVAEVLELVQLTGRDGHYPSQLSGGQQQRVALARAIVFGPNALLLDEPLGALDRNLRGTLQAEIRRIHREVGTTFVFVTHDQEEAMNLSDRIALFNNGRIEQVGTPEDLYQRPETLFAARFLGDSNVFEPAAVGVPAGDGDRALVVRPEDMHVTADDGEVPPGANAVRATVADLEYLGAYRMAVLAFPPSTTGPHPAGPGAPTGKVRLGAADSGLTLGQTVTAWWPVARQRLVAR